MNRDHKDSIKEALENADKAVYQTQMGSGNDNLGFSQQAIDRVEQLLKVEDDHSPEHQRAKDKLRLLKETQAVMGAKKH
ncbi:hypothetical protein [Alkalihalophilus marmarensis]|uniref:hypothetical protein n=1 Tax=Alkalihalophilus marmarensis TaxID=521377 RepID=UPI002DBDDE69|nr:hypothetical protein [Alkalihalophilus marmarensis]MEC2074082.1 hypothetical protein [Alkalihalophilus marmarensis]